MADRQHKKPSTEVKRFYVDSLCSKWNAALEDMFQASSRFGYVHISTVCFYCRAFHEPYMFMFDMRVCSQWDSIYSWYFVTLYMWTLSIYLCIIGKLQTSIIYIYSFDLSHASQEPRLWWSMNWYLEQRRSWCRTIVKRTLTWARRFCLCWTHQS